MNTLRRFTLIILVAILGVSCSDESRMPSPSQQAVGLYRGELAIVDEITGDTLESQGGITLRVDPMKPGVVKFSLLRVRFANIEVGDVYLDANIERYNETYLVVSAYGVRAMILKDEMALDVDLTGWQEHNDLHLIMRTSMLWDSFVQPQGVIISYSGRRNS